MSSLFISLLIALECFGFSSAKTSVEKIGSSLGISDPYEIGKVAKSNIDPFENIKGEKSDSQEKSIGNIPVSLKTLKSFPQVKKSIPDPDISAEAAFVYDIDSGKVLYSKNPDKIRPIASVTKMMTSIVVIENKNLNEVVTVSSAASWIMGSKMHLYTGEKIRVKELIFGMLVASGNDAAKALEDHFGRDDLVGLMNEKAKWLGLTETSFEEATGLNQKNHSSAKDLAILAEYNLKNPLFNKIVKTRKYTAVSANGNYGHPLSTTNRLLNNYPDIFGIKTGYTEEAGNCLVAGAQRQGHRVVSIVLNASDDDSRFYEARELLDWAFKYHSW